jgi:ribosome maturation factor RimP
MIKKEFIESIVSELVSPPEFLVDVRVDKVNNIQVFVDSTEQFDIDSCKRISRKLEEKLDRDKEDFMLEVSSPGLDKPFKVKEQYQKYLNRQIDLWADGDSYNNAEIIEVSDDSITIAFTEKKQRETKTYLFNQIEKAKPSISFK